MTVVDILPAYFKTNNKVLNDLGIILDDREIVKDFQQIIAFLQ